jgi:4-amino-4-deoxy-L-arabinose transferase-like glycosyltransferase
VKNTEPPVNDIYDLTIVSEPAPDSALSLTTSGIGRKLTRLFLGAILLISCVLCYVLLRTDRFGAYHDDGIYVSTARALAEGQGYRIISLPDEPAQTKYPPFYPFLLSIIWRVYPEFPQNLTWMMLLSVIATLSFLLVAWRYLVKYDYATHWQALIVVAMTALNWRIMILATSVYSEMMFALLTVAALYVTEKHEKSAKPLPSGLIAGMLIGLAFLTRSSGVALVISVAAYFVLRRQWKKVLLPVAVASMFVIGWIAWCYFNKTDAQGLNTPYYTSYLGHLNQVVSDLQAQRGSSKPAILVGIAVENVVGGVLVSLPLVCAGLRYDAFAGLSGYGLAAAFCAVFLILVLVVIGFFRSLTERVRLLHIYVLACLGLYLFWLPGISYDRFLMPLLPFLQLFLVRELAVLVSLARNGMLAAGGARKISAAFIGLMLVVVVGLTLYGSVSGAYSSFAALRTSSARAAEDSQAIAWIKEHTETSENLMCYRDPKFFLYTGHKAVRPFPMTEGYSWEEDDASMDKLAQSVFRIIDEASARYVVTTSSDFELEGTPEQHRKTFSKLIERHPQNFALVFESADGGSRIYRIVKTAR